MIYLFMNIFCSWFHWNTSVFTSVKLCSYVSLMTTQTTNSHSNMPVFSPNTLITPLELGPAVVCWFSLLVKWTLLVIYEYCGFKNDFRKEKVATLLGIFTFNLRNIGLISRVDLLSKCCCVKLFSFQCETFITHIADWPGCWSFDPAMRSSVWFRGASYPVRLVLRSNWRTDSLFSDALGDILL